MLHLFNEYTTVGYKIILYKHEQDICIYISFDVSEQQILNNWLFIHSLRWDEKRTGMFFPF
jgi:hypothetical protein